MQIPEVAPVISTLLECQEKLQFSTLNVFEHVE